MSINLMTRVFQSETLGPTLRLIMLALADNANDHGVCWPSISTTCSKTGLSERAVRTNIRALEAEGYLRVTVGEGPGGANLYTVIPNPAGNEPMQEMPPAGNAPGRRCPKVRQEVPRSAARGAPKPSLTSTESSERVSNSSDEMIDRGFEEFWKTHPRPKYRDACRGLFRKAVQSGEHPSKIVNAAQIYAREQAGSKAKGNIAFICQSDNWLKKRPWRDVGAEPDREGDRSAEVAIDNQNPDFDLPAYLAERVNAGVYVAASAFTTSIVHEVVRRNLLTSQQLRGIGVHT